MWRITWQREPPRIQTIWLSKRGILSGVTEATDRIRFSSKRSATTEPSVYAQKTRAKTAMKKDTSISVENPQCGKNHASPQTAEYTMREKITTMGAQGQRPFAPPSSSPHAAVTRWRQLPLSLSLSHSLSLHTRYTTTLQICDNLFSILCPKSYL